MDDLRARLEKKPKEKKEIEETLNSTRGYEMCQKCKKIEQIIKAAKAAAATENVDQDCSAAQDEIKKLDIKILCTEGNSSRFADTIPYELLDMTL